MYEVTFESGVMIAVMPISQICVVTLLIAAVSLGSFSVLMVEEKVVLETFTELTDCTKASITALLGLSLW